jgi:hypothetical protein
MNAPDNLFIPILRWLIRRSSNRIDMNLDSLAFQLRHLAITKSLAERRKSLEKIGDFAHWQSA